MAYRNCNAFVIVVPIVTEFELFLLSFTDLVEVSAFLFSNILRLIVVTRVGFPPFVIILLVCSNGLCLCLCIFRTVLFSLSATLRVRLSCLIVGKLVLR